MTAQLQQAVVFHRAGNIAEAERCCAEALRAEPANVQALLFLGMLQGQRGRFAEAVAAFDRAIALRPDYAEAHNNRGIALCSLGRFEDAVVSFDKALSVRLLAADVLNNRGLALGLLKRPKEALASHDAALAVQPQFIDAMIARGAMLHELRRHGEALAAYDSALALKPQFPELLYNRAIVLIDMTRFADALMSLDRALAMQPNYADAWNNRGNVLQSLGRIEEAVASFDRAIALKPDLATAHHNRCFVLRHLGRLMESLAAAEHFLKIRPNDLDGWNDRGLALKEMRRLDEALASFNRAAALDPHHLGTLNNLGTTLWDMDRVDEAIASFDQAILIDPDFVSALNNRGSLVWARKRLFAPAVRDFEKVLAIEPDYAYARGDLTHVKMYAADWSGFAEETRAIDRAVRAGKRAAVPFIYQAISESPADLLACARTYALDKYPAGAAIWAGTPRRPGKIRLGYVCGEFRDQATSYLTAGLYENHDRDRFTVTAFDAGRSDGSPLRRRLEAAFDQFIDISKLDARRAAETIAAKDIDILVNLNGYYGALRMDVFARRPAPIQVNFLGFPGTLGAPYIDYIVADACVIPPEDHPFYVEKVVTLPECYQVNDAKRALPAPAVSRKDHGLPEQSFVFCHFNYSYKLTPETFARWMAILRQVDSSVLWLLEGNGPFAGNLRREADALGVAADRLIFAPVLPHEQHLARLALGDLFLDSLPYNAHTTGSDALWMGLPLLTCRGRSFAGRVAASLLRAVDLPELVTETAAEYEALAVSLAREPERLQALRQKLAQSRSTSPLFDTARFTRHIESAYATMVERWLAGAAPESFSAAGSRVRRR